MAVWYFVVLAGLLLLPTMNVYGFTFNDCYSSMSKNFLMASIFTPTSIDLTDPEVKGFFSNMCNFFHEKTGKWFTTGEEMDEAINTYGYEFVTKYKDTIPQSIIEFYRNIEAIN